MAIDTQIWGQACDLVAEQLPDTLVSFEWPGTINVRVANDLELVYGPANETINADINVLVEHTWQPLERTLPASLVTDVPSDEKRAIVIAGAIVASVRQWAAEQHPTEVPDQ